jgi:dihydroflavonol-4-reductase
MATAFVTGATGFLGRHLVEHLRSLNWQVMALVRPGSPVGDLEKMGAHVARGDITDRRSITRAIPHAVDVVFHTAADTSVWGSRIDRLLMTNVEGTRNAIYSAFEAQAKCFVHTSSAMVYGFPRGTFDERSPQLGPKFWNVPLRSKILAEAAVRKATVRGLDVVIVNPGPMIGGHDRGQLWRLMGLVGDGPSFQMPGAACFTDVKAVAAAMVRAAEVGRPGENYLLGGKSVYYADIAAAVAQAAGLDAPTAVRGTMGAYATGIAHTLAGALRRKPPTFPLEAAWMMSSIQRFSSAKAERDLGYVPPDLKASIQAAAEWLNGAPANPPSDTLHQELNPAA